MKGSGRRGAGTVRIIGGKWRSRRLTAPEVAGLRPTADRVRETLFNWLAPAIEGARCLDLFAGTGALGFEAASRGAANVVMVDCSRRVVRTLREAAQRLDASSVEIFQADAIEWLSDAANRYDIVFLDPPFGQGLLERSSGLLKEGGLLRPESLIYVENASGSSDPIWPKGWSTIRKSRAGNVAYYLIEGQ